MSRITSATLLQKRDGLRLSAARGQDVLNQEVLTRGFTHASSSTFPSADDLTGYMGGHKRHAAFGATFMAALEKVVVNRHRQATASAMSLCRPLYLFRKQIQIDVLRASVLKGSLLLLVLLYIPPGLYI
ncbi:hypothetical protein C2845_PM17G01810 [Panicum miliaceum]|uniref:Stress-response A/B barrel domain-containing protein n=1 Tax=Panicum miliaceum TaxID=4540 RepID=A0A3L6Q0C5_PANMI|nr:hypothetical protein C2845_PM17G01810 [Panicum miliaceum]